MMITFRGSLAVLAFTVAAVLAPAGPASAGTAVLAGIHLHDADSNMQSFARDPADGTWVFTQVMQSGRFGHDHTWHLDHGDLTLTRTSPDGKTILGWMYLLGYGHGISIGLQPTSSGSLLVWTEAKAVQGPTSFADAFGTQVARFGWASGRTLQRSDSRARYFNVRPGSYRVAPSYDPATGLVAVRWAPASLAISYSIYKRTDLLAGVYTAPVLTIGQPSPLPSQPTQGWAVMPSGTQIALLTGASYSTANPPPGNTWLSVFGPDGWVSQAHVTQPGPGAGEPEGTTWGGGSLGLLHGFADYVTSTARTAWIYAG